MDEVPKHRKKSQKHPPKKAKHKHHYENCVFRYSTWREDQLPGIDRWQLSIGEYCPECGKIGSICDTTWRITRKGQYGYRSVWNDHAILQFNEETRTLPFFVVEDIFKCKCVDLQ